MPRLERAHLACVQKEESQRVGSARTALATAAHTRVFSCDSRSSPGKGILPTFQMRRVRSRDAA